MRLHLLSRTLLLVISLVTGLGHSFGALAHGAAHALASAHESLHHASHQHHDTHEHVAVPSDQHAAPWVTSVSSHDHHHEHQHTILDAGLKSRSDAAAHLVMYAPSPLLLVAAVAELATPVGVTTEPPSERRHTAVSPRAPPSR